jgi:hypothetical protein
MKLTAWDLNSHYVRIRKAHKILSIVKNFNDFINDEELSEAASFTEEFINQYKNEEIRLVSIAEGLLEGETPEKYHMSL